MKTMNVTNLTIKENREVRPKLRNGYKGFAFKEQGRQPGL